MPPDGIALQRCLDGPVAFAAGPFVFQETDFNFISLLLPQLKIGYRLCRLLDAPRFAYPDIQ